ncbi:MAG TPA: HAMP domain-containing sensor histidine kinase [Candidatus Wallbacteria bacterium]|nr:HAMP domain-containing sensor histidine kinase [Candidatus Wallbacteria bacterium]
MKKSMDRFIIILAAAALISMLPAAAYYHGQYLENAARGPLEKIKNEIRDSIKKEICNYAGEENYSGDIFYDPVIRLGLSDMSVFPPRYKAKLLAELELKHAYFDSSVLERLISAVKTAPPETAAQLLSYYLNDRADSYVYEKAVLYIYLIKIKSDLGRPFDEELSAFKNLAAAVKNDNEIKFLYEKLKLSVVSSKTSAADSAGDILSGVNITGGKPDDAYPADEKIPALFLSVKSEALSGESSGGINIRPLNTDGGRVHMLVSAVVEPLSCKGKEAGRGAAEKIAAAGVVNIDNLNAAIKRKHNARLSVENGGGINSMEFCGPYKLIADNMDFNRNYFIEAAFYLPLIITIIVFYILKKRENEAYRLSVNMTDFVSKISHQLKTPLSSSLLYLELAEKHLESGEEEKARGAIALAHEQAKSLSFLFENYSVLNRIFSDNVLLNIIEADIEEELILHIKSYGAQIENAVLKVTFELAEDNRALIDKWAFYNIIANLISNSLKYSKKSTTEIVFRSEISGGRLALSISDNGPGVSETDAPKIFDKFYKGEASGGEFRSSGLGLYIARALAVKMNGELELDDNYKNGARFVLYLRIPS